MMDLLTAPMEVTKVDVVGVSVISLSLMYWFWSALKVVHVLHYVCLSCLNIIVLCALNLFLQFV